MARCNSSAFDGYTICPSIQLFDAVENEGRLVATVMAIMEIRPANELAPCNITSDMHAAPFH